MLRVKKNDNVIVIAGRDKGKKGMVIDVFPRKSKVLVAGVNVVSKHVKPSATRGAGCIIKKELPIHISNVMHNDPKLGIPVRVGFKILTDGKKVRYSKKSGEVIDIVN